jgi:hypothetical protein
VFYSGGRKPPVRSLSTSGIFGGSGKIAIDAAEAAAAGFHQQELHGLATFGQTE